MFELRIIDLSKLKFENLYKHSFKLQPNQGDWIEIDIEGVGVVFEVVKIIHSSKGHGSDIYVRRLGSTPEALKSLVQINDNL